MAYTKHIWDCDELITADKLNHIEDGIVEAEQSGGGGGVTLHEYIGTIASVPAGGSSYVEIPISTLGVTDSDDLTIVSCEYYRAEYRMDVPGGTDGVVPGYTIRRDDGANNYVRLWLHNNSSYSFSDAKVKITYTINGESSGGSDLQILRKTLTATVTTYANSQFIAVLPLNAGGESINPNNILGITGVGVSDPVTEHSLVQAYLMDYQIVGNQVTVVYWNPTNTSQAVECSVTVTYKG